MVIYEAQQVLEDGLRLAREKQYEQAIACFTQVVQMDSQNAVAFYHRAHAYAALEQFTAARKDFKRSVRLNDNEPQPLFFLGVLLTREGQFEQALWCFERAASLGHKAAEGQLVQLRKLGKQKKQTAPLGPLPDEAPPEQTTADKEDDEPEVIPTTATGRLRFPIGQAVQDLLTDFATTYCGASEETETEMRRGLFGRGRKVDKRRVYWKVSPLPEGEGATLRFAHQTLRLNIACTAAGFELTVWGKRATNGLLKYQQEGELGEVFRQQIPTSLPALLAALHQLIATGLLTTAEGQLHYNP
ncbi:MAG: tetratricopeptide repeat protein [Chloroflexi bacterium]|nr:tetratricopeptide repeat protein [Chloroflexota bacterium]